MRDSSLALAPPQQWPTMAQHPPARSGVQDAKGPSTRGQHKGQLAVLQSRLQACWVRPGMRVRRGIAGGPYHAVNDVPKLGKVFAEVFVADLALRQPRVQGLKVRKVRGTCVFPRAPSLAESWTKTETAGPQISPCCKPRLLLCPTRQRKPSSTPCPTHCAAHKHLLGQLAATLVLRHGGLNIHLAPVDEVLAMLQHGQGGQACGLRGRCLIT
jgi:hypothetical protein